MDDLSQYSPPPHPHGLLLEGRFVRLEPLSSEHHARFLYEANTHPGGEQNWAYLPYGPFASLDAYAGWLEEVERQTDPSFFTIIRTSDNLPVGVASYLRIKPRDGSIEVGHIHFSPLLQRTKGATEAMYLMMEWAFEAGYRRYEWKCNAKNLRSRAAAQRLGLSYEGVFRQATISKGQNRDTAWFAAIDSEWLRLKAAFTDYLNDSNWDEAGRPKCSLADLTSAVLVKTDDLAFS